MDNAAFQTTDDAPAIAVLAAVRHCANSWEGSARLLGNVRASDIARACSEAIAALNQQHQPVSEAADRIEALEAALREAERFVAYLANETDGVFAGSGTPTTCLVMIRAALAPEQDK